MISKIKSIISYLCFFISEYKSKKKYKKYFDNEYLIHNLEKLNEKDLFIFSKFIYNKQFRLLKHRFERYLNIRNLIEEIQREKKNINVLEFGVFRGDSYLFFSKNLNDEKSKIIGIDTFSDFPVSNSKWKRGKFLNTSKKYVLDLLEKYNLKSQNLLIQSSFDNKDLRKKISDTLNHIDIFHYDCDQYESTVQALEISKNFILNQKVCYLLFDDWGCFSDQVPKAFNEFYEENNKKIRYEIISSTFYTMYLKVTLVQ